MDTRAILTPSSCNIAPFARNVPELSCMNSKFQSRTACVSSAASVALTDVYPIGSDRAVDATVLHASRCCCVSIFAKARQRDSRG